MKEKDVHLGHWYIVTVSGKRVPCRVLSMRQGTRGLIVTLYNGETDRTIARTPRALQREVSAELVADYLKRIGK